MSCMNLEPVTQNEVSQKEKDKYCILMHIYGILKGSTNDPTGRAAKETQMYRTEFWTQQEKAGVEWFARIALKHVH